MITRHRITQQQDSYFEPCWQLYLAAFPQEERRPLDYQLEALAREHYHMEALLDEGQLIGLLCWWELTELLYLEHLAIMEQQRSSGYGQRILAHIKAEQDKTILLEVEPPREQIQARRIAFYERQGFHLNAHAYAQPPYAGRDFLPLLLMSHPAPLSDAQVEHFKREGLPEIHFRYFATQD